MPEQEVDDDTLNQTRREIGRMMAEVEQLADRDIAPNEFFPEFLRRSHAALAAHASAIWMKSSQGNLILQSQINLLAVGLDRDSYIRPAHDELLRHALKKGKSMLVAPHSGPGELMDDTQATNPTPFLLVLAPVLLDNEPIGVVEIFQDASRKPSAYQGYLSFLTRLAGEASRFFKNTQYRRIISQQQRWNQVDAYVRLVHGGLNPKQVAYVIANEGKRIVECERLSVAIRHGNRTEITAISGQDVVEKRSNLVQRLAQLADVTIKHGENLIYNGTIEPHWSKDTIREIEEYLNESPSKLVAVLPLADQREFGHKGRHKAAVIVEMIEDSAEPTEMGGKVDVITRHGASALYNALENNQIFLLPLWRAIGDRTQLWTSRTSQKVGLVTAGVLAALLALIIIPWPLRLEARGELVPEIRRKVFAPVDGVVKSVMVDHNSKTAKGSLVAELSNPEQERELSKLRADLQAADIQINGLRNNKGRPGTNDAEIRTQMKELEIKANGIKRQIELAETQLNTLKLSSPIDGRVTTWKPKELLLRPVQKGDALLEVANTEGKWILEVKFPESAVSHVARARAKKPDAKLPVTFVMSAAPEKTYTGTLYEVAGTAQAVEDENVVEAKVSLTPDEDLAKILIPKGDMVSGVEVRAKADCGLHPLGYVLFRQIIDFVREYVFF